MRIHQPQLLATLREILSREPYISYYRYVSGRFVRFIDWSVVCHRRSY